MEELQAARRLVLDFVQALDQAAPGSQTQAVCTAALAPDHIYRGMRPFYELRGPGALAEKVWSPLKRAMPLIQRRPDIFFASHDHLRADGPLWVVAMGNLLGDFTAPWLGIPPSGKTTYLPYASLCRIEDGAIAETVEFLDLLAVMTQAGLNPLAGEQSGGQIMSPGPLTHDGLIYSAQDAVEGQRSLELTLRMLSELAEGYTSPADHIARNWRRDMNWFGPAGIGASLGYAGYSRGHTGPFNDRLDILEIHDWEIATAEGAFSAVMWWPCLRMRNTGDYMGVPTNDAVAEMRVIDLYRRDGDRLAENWIFIDMLHFLAQQGVDLLAQMGA